MVLELVDEIKCQKCERVCGYMDGNVYVPTECENEVDILCRQCLTEGDGND